MKSNNRRLFIKRSALAGAGVVATQLGLSAKSYNRIIGANDRVRVGVVGFSGNCLVYDIFSFLGNFFNCFIKNLSCSRVDVDEKLLFCVAIDVI